MNPKNLKTTATQISRTTFNGLISDVAALRNSNITGGNQVGIGGQQIYVPDNQVEPGCWARVIDYAYDYSGQPISDLNGGYLYQWVECVRFDGGNGGPEWHDKTLANSDGGPRGSVNNGDGTYEHLLCQINGDALHQDMVVWAYPGYCNQNGNATTPTNWEHLTDDRGTNYAIAQSDWVNGADFTGWKVSVKDCKSADNTSDQFGNAFDVYFLDTHGNLCPAVFGPRGDVNGDVITYEFDYKEQKYICTAPQSYDDILGTVKFFYPQNGQDDQFIDFGTGWHVCDGTNPAGNKLGVSLPDTRGLFTRATDQASSDALWTDGSTGVGSDLYVGAADNTGGDGGQGASGAGGRAGISSSRQLWGNYAASEDIVQRLEDVQSWAGPASDGDPNPYNNVVVCPPTYVLQQIIRYK